MRIQNCEMDWNNDHVKIILELWDKDVRANL